jgi:CDP-glycerol glycerophosphotransferase (TagB/SpsB family)
MNPKNLNFLSYLNSISEELSIDLIFRPHLNTNFSSREVSELRSFKSLKFMPQSDYGEIEEILTISDILITDNSSISLDYILLNRPVLFLNTPSSFSLGTFKEEILKFGKKVDQPEIKYFLDLYLNKKSQYFRDCPQHMETLKTIYDDPNTLASSNYIERIKKII